MLKRDERDKTVIIAINCWDGWDELSSKYEEYFPLQNKSVNLQDHIELNLCSL
jgi:hypothetical protein